MMTHTANGGIVEHHGPSYIDRYAEPLGNGRAVMRVDTVFDGVLVDSHTEGSPAPIDMVRAHEGRVTL